MHRNILIGWFIGAFLLLLISSSYCAEDINTLLVEYIKKYYPYEKIQISRITSSKPLPEHLPDKVTIEEVFPHKAVLLLQYKETGQIRVKVAIKGFERVVFAKRFLRKGEVLERADLYVGIVEADRVPSDAVRRPEEVLGKTVSRSISPNIIIRESMVISGPLIRKGKPVLIVVETPTFRITAPGRLNETASVGELVKVINLSTKKTVIGILIDENTVRIEL